MIKKATSYLQFLWHSTNEHGVHSPFVFDLLTKCLYLKSADLPAKSFLNNKTNNAIDKILKYLRPKNAIVCGQTNGIIEELLKLNQVQKIDVLEKNKDFDLAIFISDFDFTIFEALTNHIQNDSFCLFISDGMNPWNEVKNHPKVTVSIDCFYLKLVFFRKEQLKQNFVIRL